MLRRAGFAVREVTDGVQAVDAATSAPPDLAVLDVKMPAMDGFEACRRLKSNEATRHVPVLLLSATFLDSEAQVEGLDTGADAYLTQPVEAPVLAATIRSLLRARTAEAEVRLAALEWRTTFDAISDAVAVLEPDGAVQRANRAFTACFGEDLTGRRVEELAGLSTGDDLTVGGRIFRVRLDRLADVHGLHTDARTVVTLSDITAAMQAEVQRAAALVAEQTISRTLQQSLLPERLPLHADVELSAWHVAAEQKLIIGGDWYDVIETEGCLWLVMGDIAGHGVLAAAQAGQLRHSLRVYAHEGFSITQSVQRLNELVTETGLTEMATLCIAAIDDGSDVVSLVVAGHPPPLLLPRTGAARLADAGGGLVLGVPGTRYEAYSAPFEPGDRLVLYTDGLVERPREPIDDGLRRLVATADGVAGLEDLRKHLVRELVDTSALRDDIAVLLAQRR
jgi:DNA-binding response OmpR family regulator